MTTSSGRRRSSIPGKKVAAHTTRRAVKKAVPKKTEEELGLDQLFDVAHRYKKVSDHSKLLKEELAGLRDDVFSLATRWLKPGADGKVTGQRDVLGDRVQVTVVAPTTIQFDEAAIEKAVGPDVWDEITTTRTIVTFDPVAFEDAVASGKIPRKVLTDHVKEVPKGNPYPKIT